MFHSLPVNLLDFALDNIYDGGVPFNDNSSLTLSNNLKTLFLYSNPNIEAFLPTSYGGILFSE
jgi:hypothetical protein